MNRRLLTLFAAGILFGAGLAISGMTDPARVVGFLDVTGAWDPALILVMAGAVGVFGIAMAVQRKHTAGRGWFGTALPSRAPDPIDGRLISGAIVFGAGWGLSGFCPGPALANLGALRIEALIFVPAMIAGMLIARVGFGADRD